MHVLACFMLILNQFFNVAGVLLAYLSAGWWAGSFFFLIQKMSNKIIISNG